MQPNTRLNKGNCDKKLAPDFHRRYRGIVGSLGCLATTIRPHLAWTCSELIKYVQFSGKNHKLAAEHICLTFAVLGNKRSAILKTLMKTTTFWGAGWMRTGPRMPTSADRAHSYDEYLSHRLEESAPRQRVTFHSQG